MTSDLLLQLEQKVAHAVEVIELLRLHIEDLEHENASDCGAKVCGHREAPDKPGVQKKFGRATINNRAPGPAEAALANLMQSIRWPRLQP